MDGMTVSNRHRSFRITLRPERGMGGPGEPVRPEERGGGEGWVVEPDPAQEQTCLTGDRVAGSCHAAGVKRWSLPTLT